MNDIAVSNKSLVYGKFIRELKNRFLCEVEIDGTIQECYVPSSCHLSNFLKLAGKRVILARTQAKNSRTKYALYAMPFKRNYIILNTSLANNVITKDIHSRKLSYLGKRKEVLTEHYVDGYKADIYLPRSKTIVEIKSILSSTDEAIFPTVYSERTQEQLKYIQKLLSEEYKVYFIIVSLNPYLKKILIDAKTPFYTELCKCLKKGMRIKAYTSCLNNFEIVLKRELPIFFINTIDGESIKE